MSKRSQIQMGENVLILFIFFILLIFAVVFYTRLQSTKTTQAVEADVSGRGLQIAEKVSFLPEVQCTKNNAEVFPGCYDKYSIIALDALSSQKEFSEYYYTLFGFSRIYAKELFPVGLDYGKEWNLYNNPKENFTSKLVYNTPIILCDFVMDPGIKTCYFSVLTVETYT